MPQSRKSLLKWASDRRGVRRWTKAAQSVHGMRMSQLRSERAQARKLRYWLNELISVADNRLALPMIGSNTFSKPHGTDWAWRPTLWRESLGVPGMSSVRSKAMLGSEITLFHDCKHSELTLRQLRNSREADLAPYGLRMDVFAFDGSFLSLVLDFPQQAVDGLTRRHLIRMDTIV